MKIVQSIALIATWGATCLGSFLLGRCVFPATSPRQHLPMPVAQEIKPTIVNLPPRQFISAVSAGNPESKVAIMGRVPDLKTITGVYVFTGAQGDCGLTFYDGSGNVKSILIRRQTKRAREWGFREDGSIEYVTEYRNDTGNRQEFDSEGKPTRKITEIVHGD